jgi:hypothetical protein
MFEWDAQKVLNDYLGGSLSEEEFLHSDYHLGIPRQLKKNHLGLKTAVIARSSVVFDMPMNRFLSWPIYSGYRMKNIGEKSVAVLDLLGAQEKHRAVGRGTSPGRTGRLGLMRGADQDAVRLFAQAESPSPRVDREECPSLELGMQRPLRSADPPCPTKPFFRFFEPNGRCRSCRPEAE